MSRSPIRDITYPRTEPPPEFVRAVVGCFQAHAPDIDTTRLEKGLTSNQVLGVLRADLVELGFEVEAGKKKGQKIHRPVLFGESGVPELKYEIDAYHPGWRCGLEVEAGRGWMGNAVYRDLILGALMVDVDHLIIAVANEYWSKTGGRKVASRDYQYASRLADSLYAQGRFRLPYRLTVIGY